MNTYFDEKKWDSLVTTRPNWYLEIYPYLRELAKCREASSRAESNKIRDKVYGYFETRLKEDLIILAGAGDDADREREKIDKIVIHHTSRPPGMTISLLNAIHFTRLYIPQYAEPKYEADKHFKGNPIWSGHIRNGKQVFYAYHWFVRMDGRSERLLEDNEIGWQAGNWDVNKKSIAICFDNDYTDNVPSKKVLETVAQIIKAHYPTISRENIIGHREVNLKTECPGNTFLGGWKEVLTAML